MITLHVAGLVLSLLSAEPASISPVVAQAKEQPPAARTIDPKAGPIEIAPGEFIEPLVPAKPLSVEDAKAIEAEKQTFIGYMFLSRQQLHKARDAFSKAVENNPVSLTALAELTTICFQLGRADEGMEFCKRALKLSPDNHELLVLYAMRSEQLGDLDGAVNAYERASKNPKMRETDGQAYLEVQVALARIYQQRNAAEKLAVTLRELIDIAEHPWKYDITPVVRKRLDERKLSFYQQLVPQ